jgi:UDP-N-acetylglucosamine:LPS N-acetylglucosamine transferase
LGISSQFREEGLMSIASALVGASKTRDVDDRRADGALDSHHRSFFDVPPPSVARQKVLAVASGGGHWVQLQRMVQAFAGHDIAFITTLPSYRNDVGSARFYVVKDANRWNKLGLLKMLFQVARVVLRERPDVVISTGAAPGYFTLRIAKLLGARTAWVDSIANVDRLSMCGERVGRYADLWLTQWPHLAQPDGPHFQGSVL